MRSCRCTVDVGEDNPKGHATENAQHRMEDGSAMEDGAFINSHSVSRQRARSGMLWFCCSVVSPLLVSLADSTHSPVLHLPPPARPVPRL